MFSKKNLPRVDIIIRTKNEEKWIGHCLEAIFLQKVNASFEVIIVDVSGKIVLRKTTQNNASLDVSSLANGYYFIGTYSNNNCLIPFVKD